MPTNNLLNVPYFEIPCFLYLCSTGIKKVVLLNPENNAGKNLCKPLKKGNFKNVLLSKIFKEHPVSKQLSFKINRLIELANLEEIILIILSFLLFLIPPTKE